MIDDLGDMINDLSDESTDRDRPFTGQRHTHQGERGRTEVRGIRFRDLADCAVRAFVRSVPFEDHDLAQELYARIEDGTLNYNDLFRLEDWEGMDPLAFIQNLGCEVEKAMGIFPNYERGGHPVSHNKSRQMMKAVGALERVLDIDRADPHALPGSALRHVKSARKVLLRDIRKRRDARKRAFWRGDP